MDRRISYMEKMIRNYGLLPRRFPGELMLEKAGFIGGKDYRIRNVFPTVNFSLLSEGSGTLLFRGREYRLAAPCVFMQLPLEEVAYGPDRTWEEMFFCYRRSDLKLLAQRNFYDEARLVWPIANNGALWSVVREMKGLLRRPENEAEVDRVDRIGERIILESLLSRQDAPLSAAEKIVRLVCADLSDLDREVTLDELADQYRISLPTLRRYWSEYMKVPLSRFRSELIMREACRMLVDTSDPVHVIAAGLKFSDALYFSRKFSRENGMSPSQYRERFVRRTSDLPAR